MQSFFECRNKYRRRQQKDHHLEVFGLVFGTKIFDNVIEIDSNVQILTNLYELLERLVKKDMSEDLLQSRIMFLEI